MDFSLKENQQIQKFIQKIAKLIHSKLKNRFSSSPPDSHFFNDHLHNIVEKWKMIFTKTLANSLKKSFLPRTFIRRTKGSLLKKEMRLFSNQKKIKKLEITNLFINNQKIEKSEKKQVIVRKEKKYRYKNFPKILASTIIRLLLKNKEFFSSKLTSLFYNNNNNNNCCYPLNWQTQITIKEFEIWLTESGFTRNLGTLKSFREIFKKQKAENEKTRKFTEENENSLDNETKSENKQHSCCFIDFEKLPALNAKGNILFSEVNSPNNRKEQNKFEGFPFNPMFEEDFIKEKNYELEDWKISHFKYFLKNIIIYFLQEEIWRYLIGNSKFKTEMVEKYLDLIPIFLRGSDDSSCLNSLKDEA